MLVSMRVSRKTRELKELCDSAYRLPVSQANGVRLYQRTAFSLHVQASLSHVACLAMAEGCDSCVRF